MKLDSRTGKMAASADAVERPPEPRKTARLAPMLVGVVLALTGRATADCCLDVVLVVDGTGSMVPALENVKAGLDEIVDAAFAGSGGDLRMGVVRFVDGAEVDQTLTEDLDAVRKAIMSLTATGGGAEPEPSDEALRYVVTGMQDCASGAVGDLRAGCQRILVIVTDGRPGGCDDAYEDGVDDARALAVADAAAGAAIIAPVLIDNGSRPSEAHPEGVELFVMSAYATITGTELLVVPSDGTGTGDVLDLLLPECDGACCLPDCTCLDALDAAECDLLGGEFQGSGSACATTDCPRSVCPGDIDGDCAVDTADLIALLADWGPCPRCRSDLNGDDVVDAADLVLLLAAWGQCG